MRIIYRAMRACLARQKLAQEVAIAGTKKLTIGTTETNKIARPMRHG